MKDAGDIKFDEFPDDPTTGNVRHPLSVGDNNKKVLKSVLEYDGCRLAKDNYNYISNSLELLRHLRCLTTFSR